MFTASKAQTATYLLGVCPFSIAFLVFLNSSVSFVITDIIGIERGIGEAVGDLGSADELLALVACPLWGILSDRIGVRTVSTTSFYGLDRQPRDVIFAPETSDLTQSTRGHLDLLEVVPWTPEVASLVCDHELPALIRYILLGHKLIICSRYV